MSSVAEVMLTGKLSTVSTKSTLGAQFRVLTYFGSRKRKKLVCLQFVILNSVLMSGYSPGLSGIRGPPRAIQGPPPHEDRPDVEKKK